MDGHEGLLGLLALARRPLPTAVIGDASADGHDWETNSSRWRRRGPKRVGRLSLIGHENSGVKSKYTIISRYGTKTILTTRSKSRRGSESVS